MRYPPKVFAVTATYSENASGLYDAYECNGSFTITLASPATRRRVFVVNTGSGVITIATAGTSATINGSSTLALGNQYDGVELVANGLTGSSAAWRIVGSFTATDNSLASGAVILGNASGYPAAVVPTGDVTIDNAGVTAIGAGKVTRAQLSAAAARTSRQVIGGTIATTGNTDEYCVAQEAGTLASVEVTPLVALTANDTNYLTWTITNLGQSGGGSTVMLAATAPNTTKATGGTGLAINTKNALTVSGTGSNLVVAAGDLLLIRAAATGTLANTVTRPIYQLRFTGTT